MSRLAPVRRAADDIFLDHRHFLRRHFHAQVTARHHDAIGRFEDFFQLFRACGFSSLAITGTSLPSGGNDLLYAANVGSDRTNDRATMSTLLQPKLKIGAVFGG